VLPDSLWLATTALRLGRRDGVAWVAWATPATEATELRALPLP
jgi:hypothetical protein